jgi:hypothetical protein
MREFIRGEFPANVDKGGLKGDINGEIPVNGFK